MILLAAALVTEAPSAAQVRAADAPELAARGAHRVGVRTLSVTSPDQPDVLEIDLKTGVAPRADRVLALDVWYPATLRAGQAEAASYRFPTPRAPTIDPASLPAVTTFRGRAARDAEPAPGRFPLVVLSHGYGNSAVMFSELGEALASQGYIVAAVDHGDAKAPDRAEQVFLNAVVHRAADQRAVIAELSRRARAGAGTVERRIDPERVALLGYSMGGFGALAAAGAGYDPAGPLLKGPAAPLVAPFAEGAPGVAAGVPANLRAVVLMAPWGGAGPNRVWTPASLARIKVPSLTVVGDADDISGYEDGVGWIVRSMTGSDRRMLVYRSARHNVALNASPDALRDRFEFMERFDDPVWRKDRMLGINTHFISAFLDLHLKGRADRAAYLDPPTPAAEDGVWPLKPGENAGSRTAGRDQPAHWRGFQRRWALGLELHRFKPGETRATAASPAAD